jgi:fructose-1-phosphate kinase PfkB-like protein
LFTNGQESYYCKSENVAVNSTVGAGDSMISAVCVALKRKVDNTELIKMAVAAGTAAVTTSGTNLFYYDKYKEIYDKISTTKL